MENKIIFKTSKNILKHLSRVCKNIRGVHSHEAKCNFRFQKEGNKLSIVSIQNGEVFAKLLVDYEFANIDKPIFIPSSIVKKFTLGEIKIVDLEGIITITIGELIFQLDNDVCDGVYTKLMNMADEFLKSEPVVKISIDSEFLGQMLSLIDSSQIQFEIHSVRRYDSFHYFLSCVDDNKYLYLKLGDLTTSQIIKDR